jgi:hypothetical protein
MVVDNEYPGGPDRILGRGEAGGYRVFLGTERSVRRATGSLTHGVPR